MSDINSKCPVKVELSDMHWDMFGTVFEVYVINKNMVRPRESNPGDDLDNIYIYIYIYIYSR